MAKTWRGRAVRAGCVGVTMVLAAGCLQQSLNPLFLLEDSVFEERLLGEWACGDESWTFKRESDTDSGSREYYRIEVQSDGKSGVLAAWLGRLDDNLFITFMPMLEIDLPNAFFNRHLVQVFTFGRVTLEPTRLRLAMLDSGWAEKTYKAGLLTLGVRRSRGQRTDGLDVLLTAQSDELQRFARAYADDDSAFGERIEFVRRVAPGAATPDSPAREGGHCYSEGK